MRVTNLSKVAWWYGSDLKFSLSRIRTWNPKDWFPEHGAYLLMCCLHSIDTCLVWNSSWQRCMPFLMSTILPSKGRLVGPLGYLVPRVLPHLFGNNIRIEWTAATCSISNCIIIDCGITYTQLSLLLNGGNWRKLLPGERTTNEWPCIKKRTSNLNDKSVIQTASFDKDSYHFQL